MMKCLSTGQLRAFFGIALLAFGLDVQAAGLACSGVLLPLKEISSAQLNARIENLARLKLDADLALSEGGEQSAAQTMIRSHFSKELAEFIQEARGTKTEAEIKKLITAEIAKLQGRKVVEKKEEQAVRDEQGKHVVIPKLHAKYSVKESIKLSFNPGKGERIFEYIPEVNSVLMEVHRNSEKNLILYSLESKRSKILARNIRGAVLDQTNRIVWAVSSQGHLLRHDLNNKTNSEIKIDQTPLAGRTDVAIDVSPSGDMLLIKTDNTLHLFDLNKNSLKQISKEVNVAKFIHDDLIVYAPSNGGEILRLEISSGKSSYVEEYFDGVYDLYPTSDRGHVVVKAYKSLHGIKASDLSGMNKNFIRMSDDPSDYEMMLHTVKSVAQGTAFFVRHATSYSQLPELFTFDPSVGFEKITQFDLPQGGKISNFTMSPAGDKAISVHTEGSKTYLDVWDGE